jgi:two-component sensor histidine kinase
MYIASNNTPSGKSKRVPISGGEVSASRSDEFLLLREMAHRINNELTSTIGIISCMVERSQSHDVKVELTKVIEHLYDHARTYRALQMPSTDRLIDAAAYLRELCQSISRARLRHSGIELLLIEHPLQLSAGQCWRLGLIVSELITNASRHAFIDVGGTIRVELKKLGNSAECRVTDDGAGPEHVRPGQGLGIVQELALGFNGKIDQQFGSEGATSILSFPVEQPARSD